MLSCSSHGLDEAASAVVRREAMAGGPVAAMQGEPPEAAAEELAAARLPSPACSGTSPRARRGGRRNGLMFTLSLPQYHSLVVRAQDFTFSVQRWPSLARDDTHDNDS